MITMEEGRLLTNSQEEQLYSELEMGGISLDAQSLPFTVSDLPFPESESQKYNNSQQFASCSNDAVDNKAALQQALQLPQHYEHVEHNSMPLMHHQHHQQQMQQQMQEQELQPQLQVVYQSQTPILAKDEFAGDYNFQLILNPEGSGKHWIFSRLLKKAYVHMEEVLPLQFQWTPPEDGLWVRATLVYKGDQHRSDAVVRCHNHMAPNNASNRDINQNELRHVMRCLHTTNVYQETNKHLSVLTPLGVPEAGMLHVPVDYKFFCKNSCASGMNRRATEIVFTLENDQNHILGRRKLEIRICSCPKRDLEKEEKDYWKNLQEKNASSNPPPAGKKRKSPCVNVNSKFLKKKPAADDHQVFNINLQILGQDNALAVLKYAYDVMSGSAVRSDNLELYKPYMDQIQNKINQN